MSEQLQKLIEKFNAKLQSDGWYAANCPFHEDHHPSVAPAPKLSDLLTKNGDLVFRQAYHSETTVIRKAEIEALLEGEELNDVTVWEVIAKWNRRYSTPSDTQHLPA